jgi:spore germination cell wall hydrolase CwlJ-like protein
MINLASNAITAILVSSTVVYGAGSYNEFIKERDCLALNIYHEARGETIQGQIAVAQVTVNRASHNYFPDSVCEVVWQDNQFSWTNDGRSDRVRDQEAYETALTIAEWVLLGREDDPTNGSLFYHADRVSPFWTRKVDFETKIGDHVFYTWSGQW